MFELIFRLQITLSTLECHPFQIVVSGLSPTHSRRKFNVNCPAFMISTIKFQPFHIDPLFMIPTHSRRSPILSKLSCLLQSP